MVRSNFFVIPGLRFGAEAQMAEKPSPAAHSVVAPPAGGCSAPSTTTVLWASVDLYQFAREDYHPPNCTGG